MAILTELTHIEMAIIKNELTIANPLFSQRIELGLANFGVPKSLKYYKELSNNSLEIPIGILPELYSKLKISVNDITDNRTVASDSDFFSRITFTLNLRDYQEDMVNACVKNNIGVVEAQTGSGKTIAFTKVIFENKLNTLILVNTIELANQTIEVLVKTLNISNEEIGFVGSGIYNIKPITVGIQQTFSGFSEEEFEPFNEYFGMIIADEVQLIKFIYFSIFSYYE